MYACFRMCMWRAFWDTRTGDSIPAMICMISAWASPDVRSDDSALLSGLIVCRLHFGACVSCLSRPPAPHTRHRRERRRRRPHTVIRVLGGIVAENIGPLALYSESTVNTAQYENRALLKRRYENRPPFGHAFGAAGACSGFQTNGHAHTSLRGAARGVRGLDTIRRFCAALRHCAAPLAAIFRFTIYFTTLLRCLHLTTMKTL